MNRLHVLAFTAVLAAAGCARYKSEPPEEKRPEIAVAHSAHGDMDCTDCHEGMEKATSLAQSHRPTTEKCQECHDKDKDKLVRKWTLPPPRLSFNHALHLAKVPGKKQADKCGYCHKKLPDPGDEVEAPAMDTCTSCHNHQADYNLGRCRPCHVDLKGLQPEKYFTHQGDWLRLHGQNARPTAEGCAQCHDQTYCTACHSPQTAAARPAVIFPERVEATFIHRGDYVSRHHVEAEANPASCSRCHGPQYCNTCHALNNVSTASPGAYPVHPQGWAFRGAGKEFHGDAARRDANSCAACHDQGYTSICVGCHTANTANPVNPHPASWGAKHKKSDIDTNPMCRACHNA
jgi:hypothetical protein